MNVTVLHVTPMPLVPIPMAASPVPAMMATLAMDSLVIVRLLFTTKIRACYKYKSCCVLIKGALLLSFTKMVSCDKFNLFISLFLFSLQILMSAVWGLICVIPTPHVLILMVATAAAVKLGSLVMASTAPVRKSIYLNFIYHINIFFIKI